MATAPSDRYVTKDGKRGYVWIVSETNAGAASEWEITGVPKFGTVVLIQADITAGDAAASGTIRTKLGKATGWTVNTDDHINQQDVAQSYILDKTPLPYILHDVAPNAQGSIFGCSVVSTGSNNSITTILVIEEGY